MKKIIFIVLIIIIIPSQNALAAHRHHHKAHHHKQHHNAKAHKSSDEKIELCYPPEENFTKECFTITRKEYEEIMPTNAESEEAEEIVKSAERSEKESNSYND